MKKIIYLFLFVFLLSGCQISLSLNKPTECQPPLKVIGGQCCLDQDNNNICDPTQESSGQTSKKSEDGVDQESNRETNKNTDKQETMTETDSENDSSVNLDFESQCQPPLIAFDNGCCLDADEDGNCDEAEDVSPCGDGFCQQNEINDCCLDCGCSDDRVCVNNECTDKLNVSPDIFKNIFKPQLPPHFCGDGICQSPESSDNCCADCGCANGLVCGADNKCFVFKMPSTPLKPLSPLPVQSQPEIENWLVVILDKIEVHSSGDAKDPGELMFFSLAQSGDEKQYVKWPVGGEKAMWQGQTLLAGELEAVPLFALPEKKMADKLDIDLLFGESDMPSMVPYLNSNLDSEKIKYFFQFNSCRKRADLPAWAQLMTETIFKPFMLLMDLIHPRKCHINDFLGEIHRVFQKADDWQIGSHKVDLNNITVFYKIKRIAVPQGQTMSLKLTKVRIIDDGDKGDNKGEIVGWGRFASGFSLDSFGTETGQDKQKVFDLGQHKINGPADLITDLSAATYSVVDFPFIYGELSLFDRDTDCLPAEESPFSCYHTSNLEEVGVSSLLFFPDSESGTYVINSGGVGRADTTWRFSK